MFTLSIADFNYHKFEIYIKEKDLLKYSSDRLEIMKIICGKKKIEKKIKRIKESCDHLSTSPDEEKYEYTRSILEINKQDLWCLSEGVSINL